MTIEDCYRRLEHVAPKTNAFITVVPKADVLKKAKKAAGPLAGKLFVLKDSYVTKRIRTTAASKVLGNYLPQFDATVYGKLLEAGAILLGKMNMDAWGHGATSENTDFGVVKNPWDLERVAGGSGGGPAVAVATDCVDFAIGEDTGGSIRNPAAWCGITGLKVTYGRVSRYGCIAYASSFDTVGPTARTAEECARILQIIAGKDPYDATSSPEPVPDYLGSLHKPIKGTLVGIPRELFGKGLSEEIKKALEAARQKFEKLGVVFRDISMPLLEYGINAYYIIAPSETSSNLARYDGVRYGSDRSNFTPETKRRIMMGTYTLSAGYYEAYYKRAQQVRTLFIEEYKKALGQCDCLLMPVTPFSPTKIGEFVDDPVQSYLIDAYTTTQNLVGVPSLAFPCGFTKSGLPIGMQIVGRMFSEDLLLRLGYHYQQATDWHECKPKGYD